MNIDWILLRKQKEWLLNNGSDEAIGLIGLLDAIQDNAVIVGGFAEEEVFGTYTEEYNEELYLDIVVGDTVTYRNAEDCALHGEYIVVSINTDGGRVINPTDRITLCYEYTDTEDTIEVFAHELE